MAALAASAWVTAGPTVRRPGFSVLRCRAVQVLFVGGEEGDGLALAESTFA